jgi:uncharacterized YkwD family protein
LTKARRSQKERIILNHFKKLVLVGTLAMSSIIGVGVASASSYTVVAKDTLWTISQQKGISLTTLIQSNQQITNPNNIWAGLIINIPNTNNVTTVVPNAPTTPTTQSTFATQVVHLVNQERAKAGLNALTSNGALTTMSLDKAKDMYNRNYFDHTSPTYGSPFDMMKTYGIQFSYAGENIAKGQRTPQEVMTAWMNSAGHRQNILNYTKIGVAYYKGEWVQEFIA